MGVFIARLQFKPNNPKWRNKLSITTVFLVKHMKKKKYANKNKY